MTTRRSAGLLLHRPEATGGAAVLLGRMGGPLWAHRDRAWTIPKGEYVEGEEDPHAAALREFAEELGVPAPAGDGPDVALGEVRQSGGKVVVAWARRADLDPAGVRTDASTVTLEWPPRSGRSITVPELAEVRWWELEAARDVVVAAQAELLDRLAAHLRAGSPGGR